MGGCDPPRWRRVIIGVLLPALFISSIAIAAGCRRKPRQPSDAGSEPDSLPSPTAKAPLAPVSPPCVKAPGSFSELASRLSTNLVTVLAVVDGSSSDPNTALPLAPSPESTDSPQASATKLELTPVSTGVILGAGDQVVTSAEALGRASTVAVSLSDGRRIPARVRGNDPELDVALLVLEQEVPDALELTDSTNLRPGDWVAVLSSAFGRGPSVTAGVLRFSSAHPDDHPQHPLLDRFLGVDATIDAANWGGPVVDPGGRLVGLAAAAPRVGSRVGLVVPAEQLRRTIAQIARHGHPARVWLGLWVRPLDTDRARDLGVDPPRGLLVSRVAPGGPAQEAGIEPDDVILELAGEPVSTPSDLGVLAARAPRGQPLPLVIFRERQRRTLRLRPAQMPL